MSADEAAALATLKAFVASAEQWAAERTAWATVYDKSQALEAELDHLRAEVKRLKAMTHQDIRDAVAATLQESEWPARAKAEIARLRAMIEAAKENTDGGCAFCRRDPYFEGHAEDCGK